MANVHAYKEFRQKKEEILYCRMDDSMITRLRLIRQQTGIAVSEIIRLAIRRLIIDIDTTGSINLKIK
jgi:hypothetical protein